MISVETAEARHVAKSTPSTGIPACPRICGLTTTTYAMVMKVVRPARSSMRTVVSFSRRWKIRSSKLVCLGKGGTLVCATKRRQTQKVVGTRQRDESRVEADARGRVIRISPIFVTNFSDLRSDEKDGIARRYCVVSFTLRAAVR